MTNTPQQQIDLKDTVGLETEDGNKIFQHGVLIRTISKFLIGEDEDGLIPINIFYEPKSGKIVKSSLPLILREEYKDMLL